jgi:hypothetical protein
MFFYVFGLFAHGGMVNKVAEGRRNRSDIVWVIYAKINRPIKSSQQLKVVYHGQFLYLSILNATYSLSGLTHLFLTLLSINHQKLEIAQSMDHVYPLRATLFSITCNPFMVYDDDWLYQVLRVIEKIIAKNTLGK